VSSPDAATILLRFKDKIAISRRFGQQRATACRDDFSMANNTPNKCTLFAVMTLPLPDSCRLPASR
jgi:hypothetical protein